MSQGPFDPSETEYAHVQNGPFGWDPLEGGSSGRQKGFVHAIIHQWKVSLPKHCNASLKIQNSVPGKQRKLKDQVNLG